MNNVQLLQNMVFQLPSVIPNAEQQRIMNQWMAERDDPDRANIIRHMVPSLLPLYGGDMSRVRSVMGEHLGTPVGLPRIAPMRDSDTESEGEDEEGPTKRLLVKELEEQRQLILQQLQIQQHLQFQQQILQQQFFREEFNDEEEDEEMEDEEDEEWNEDEEDEEVEHAGEAQHV